MEIKGKVWCMFEQSGTFKQEFIKLGIPAIDLDIQNNFGQTDMQIDLFEQIEKAYKHTQGAEHTIFDDITEDDLIMAFFPCIYFCEANVRLFRFEDATHKNQTHERAIADMLERSRNRQYFFEIALKFFCVCERKNLRLIVENPYHPTHYLVQFFPYRAKIIEKNRRLRGDYFTKPTQFFFVNCEPTHGMTIYEDKKQMTVWGAKGSKQAGLCSEERSMISPDYARNFICDFILGKEQKLTQLSLF